MALQYLQRLTTWVGRVRSREGALCMERSPSWPLSDNSIVSRYRGPRRSNDFPSWAPGRHHAAACGMQGPPNYPSAPETGVGRNGPRSTGDFGVTSGRAAESQTARIRIGSLSKGDSRTQARCAARSFSQAYPSVACSAAGRERSPALAASGIRRRIGPGGHGTPRSSPCAADRPRGSHPHRRAAPCRG